MQAKRDKTRMEWIAEQMAENGMVTQAREVLAMEAENARLQALHKGLMANADQRYEELSAALSNAKAEIATLTEQVKLAQRGFDYEGALLDAKHQKQRAERAEAENARLTHTVAECRNAAGFGTDADPMDVTGWSALSSPEEVPGFIKAQFDRLLMKAIDGERFRWALSNPGHAMLIFAEATNADTYGGQPPNDAAIRLHIRRSIDSQLDAALSPNEST